MWRGRETGALAIAQEPAHGGEGWAPRSTTTRSEIGTLWAECGVNAEWGRLRSVVMRRPGAEVERVTDHRSALWLDILDPDRAREQHDDLADVYRQHGVDVYSIEDVP